MVTSEGFVSGEILAKGWKVSLFDGNRVDLKMDYARIVKRNFDILGQKGILVQKGYIISLNS